MLLALKSSAVAVIFASVQALSAHAKSGSGCSLNVMSFNLRTSLANDPCPSGCWEQRKERIRQMLGEYGPDLIGTQEGAPDQIAYFQEELGYDSIGECAGECKYNERDSIFYHSERWGLLDNKTYALVRAYCTPSDARSYESNSAVVVARCNRATRPT